MIVGDGFKAFGEKRQREAENLVLQVGEENGLKYEQWTEVQRIVLSGFLFDLQDVLLHKPCQEVVCVVRRHCARRADVNCRRCV